MTPTLVDQRFQFGTAALYFSIDRHISDGHIVSWKQANHARQGSRSFFWAAPKLEKPQGMSPGLTRRLI
jgi:hypothetical protein